MCCACRSSVSVLDNQETVRVDRSPSAAIRDYLSGLKPRMRSFETAWWISLWPRRGLHDADLDRMEFFGKDIRSFIWMPVPSLSCRKILSLDSFFALDLLKK